MSTFIPKTAFCLSLGCFKNSVDSERICGLLAQAGYEISPKAEGAEICIVNTCGFLRSAVEENIAAILDLAELKARGDVARIGVVGCLVNRYGDDLAADMPEVDFWARCEDYAAMARAISQNTPQLHNDIPPKRKKLPGEHAHVRYLKIAEGCDNRCSYCAIPGIRGSLKSLDVPSIVREAELLVQDGGREICLVAQDLTAYGRDAGDENGLIELLDALEPAMPYDVWLRLLYLQPKGVTTRLLERVASGRSVLPYLDIPIQHSSPRILSAMNRPADRDALLAIFKTAREIAPDFAMRTTCMVGFPGETRSDFEDLLRFLDDAQIDRLGAFAFSAEEGTDAASMDRPVSKRTKLARLARLMTHQEEISFARQQRFVGRTLDVVVDVVNPDGSAECRSFRDAPDVDGIVEVAASERAHQPGDRMRVLVEDVFEHDMLAKEVI